MSLTSVTKHAGHCLFLMFIIGFFWFQMRGHTGIFNYEASIEAYGLIQTILLYLPRFALLIAFPPIFSTFLGLIMYNAFPDDVKFMDNVKNVPFICFRVVTRGDYPELVINNVSKNLQACYEAGLNHFIIEVVTEKQLHLPPQLNVRETVVPKSYRTKSGTLYKARNLQYCLEDDVNYLNDEDFIVHLDEETLMTINAVRGIMNFTVDGTHDFGCGLITFGKEQIDNWFCTLADGLRVTDSMGRLRFELCVFHAPLAFSKTSFMVAKCKSERQLSFDYGLEGSVCEDVFMGRIAARDGYTFDFIQGEMWEKSPLTVIEFIKQRKRWSQGAILVILSSKIPLKNKFCLGVYFLSWYLFPVNILNVIIAVYWPLASLPLFEFILCFYTGVYTYVFIFGVLKGICFKNLGIIYFVICIIAAVLIAPLNLIMDFIALYWGVLSDKLNFEVTCKKREFRNNFGYIV